MKLSITCKSCGNSVKVKTMVSTRPELQMEKGDEFKVNCPKCGTFSKPHVNDVFSEASNWIIVSGVILGIVVTVFLWNYFGAVSTVSGIIPVLFWQQEMNAVKSFNSYMVKRK